MNNKIVLSAIVVILAVSGCGQTRSERAVTGAGAGALVGAGVGALFGDPGAGAAAGAIAGGILGSSTDEDIRNTPRTTNSSQPVNQVYTDERGNRYILRYDSRTNSYFREYI